MMCCFAAHCCSWSRCCLTRTRTHSLTHSVFSLNHNLVFVNCLFVAPQYFHSVAKLSISSSALAALGKNFGEVVTKVATPE